MYTHMHNSYIRGVKSPEAHANVAAEVVLPARATSAAFPYIYIYIYIYIYTYIYIYIYMYTCIRPGTLKLIPTPDFRNSTGGRRHRKAKENEE